MVKAAGGGGGIGMAVAHDADELRTAFETPARWPSAASAPTGSSSSVRLTARHVEVQILGPNDGTVIALGERDCSAQRRHQKLVEESPAPVPRPEGPWTDAHRARCRRPRSVGYLNAGTVEFLLDTITTTSSSSR